MVTAQFKSFVNCPIEISFDNKEGTTSAFVRVILGNTHTSHAMLTG
jgi:hypothetical protein